MTFCVECGLEVPYLPCPNCNQNGTLKEAQQWLFTQMENGGTRCPCCRQYAKVYKRKLNSSMARGLLLIRRYFKANPDKAWLHIPSYFRDQKACSSNDGALLRHWGLIEGIPNQVREDGSTRVGWYRITALGWEFVELRCRVRKHVFLYNQEVLDRPDPESTDIVEALESRFSYDELMSA